MALYYRKSLGTFLVALLSITAVAAAPLAAVGWQEKFGNTEGQKKIRSAGQFKGESTAWNLESFSALLMEPSASGEFYFGKNRAGQSYIGFRDSEPGLVPNSSRKGDEPFYRRAEGALNALIWAPGDFGDVRVSGQVNASGASAHTRQGVFARWDAGSNFYFFNIDFADGQAELLKSATFYTEKVLLRRDIAEFDANNTYRIEFEVVGDTLRGKVMAGDKVVADTGIYVDPTPHLYGRSGALLYSSLVAPFKPLEGSFANLAAVSLGRDEAAKLALDKNAWFTSKAELKKLDGSIKAYQKLLERYPNSIEALRGLAWKRATSSNKAIRSPVEAVNLASKAAELHFKALTDNLRSSGGPSQLDLARSGFVLVGALAAAGMWDIDVPVEGMVTPAGKTFIDDQGADSEGVAAATWVQWAVEVVNAQHERNPTDESKALVDFGRQAQQRVTQRQPLTGMTVPGLI